MCEKAATSWFRICDLDLQCRNDNLRKNSNNVGLLCNNPKEAILALGGTSIVCPLEARRRRATLGALFSSNF